MAQPTELPRLEKRAGRTFLSVDGRPFLALGGELHNSSASSVRHIRSIWPTVASSGANTVICPVAWNEIEAEQGMFDFSIVDELLSQARGSGQRLILAWFGAFKNATSVYAPTWVRADRERFPRAALSSQPTPLPFSYEGSMPKPVLTVFNERLREADTRAYCKLMSHLAEHDPQHTVIMMQVENEVGLLGSSRDHCPAAAKAWASPVPDAVREAISAHPAQLDAHVVAAAGACATGATWEEAFGDSIAADEIFMTWGFASYVDAVASAGAEILPLPTFTNAWLGPQPGQPTPGTYPSGGPTAAMVPLWRALAPSLGFVSPDIYVRDSATVMAQYAGPDNPLLVPEARFRAGDAVTAVGKFGAIGYHVFGLEDGLVGSQYFQVCRAMLEWQDEIIAAQTDGRIFGFALDDGMPSTSALVHGLELTVRDAFHHYSKMLFDVGLDVPERGALPDETISAARGAHPADERPFGLVVVLDESELLLIGQRFMIDVSRPGFTTEWDEVRELVPADDRWEESRFLNGDERLLVIGNDEVTAVRVRLLHIDDR